MLTEVPNAEECPCEYAGTLPDVAELQALTGAP